MGFWGWDSHPWSLREGYTGAVCSLWIVEREHFHDGSLTCSLHKGVYELDGTALLGSPLGITPLLSPVSPGDREVWPCLDSAALPN